MDDMKRRKKPLAAVTAVWETDKTSKYPDVIRVPMEDGTVVNYRIDTEQPHPCFLGALENIRWTPEGSYQHKKSRSL